jgi:hypothetical protein
MWTMYMPGVATGGPWKAGWSGVVSVAAAASSWPGDGGDAGCGGDGMGWTRSAMAAGGKGRGDVSWREMEEKSV